MNSEAITKQILRSRGCIRKKRVQLHLFAADAFSRQKEHLQKAFFVERFPLHIFPAQAIVIVSS